MGDETLQIERGAGRAVAEARAALAEAVTARHYELNPALAARYGAAGREKCLQDAHYHLSYLAESVAAGLPSLFADYVTWAKVMLEARGVPASDLARNLEVLRDVVREQLPGPHGETAARYVGEGRARLPHAPPDLPTFVADDEPHAALARAYIEALLGGRRHEASRLVLEAVGRGVSVREIYLHVFQRSQREVGRLWQLNLIGVAQEHYCTAATQLIMSQLYPRVFSAERSGRTLVAACVAGDLHEIGLRMVADFFEMEGWDTFFVGANTPTASVVQAVAERRADVLAVSATITSHVRALRELVAAVRANEGCRGVKIMAGGYPFNVAPGLWREVGADASASDAADAVETAARPLPRRPGGGQAMRAAGVALACDREGVVTEVVSDGLGVAASLAPGRGFAELCDGDCADKAEAFLGELRRKGAAFDWELVVRGREGALLTLHFAGAAEPSGGFLVVGARSRAEVARVYEGLAGINNEQANALRASLEDPALRGRESEERDAEVYEELTRLNNELAAAQRELAKKNAELSRLNEQKNRFVGLAAHDLRNPLQIIKAYSQFLLDEAAAGLAPEHLYFVRKIMRSSDFMLELVEDLLDVSKIEAGRLELNLADVDLPGLVARNVELNRHLAERKEIKILFTPPGEVPPLRLDASKVEQVLNNLIGNAVKFSPRGSTVEVALARGEGGGAVVSVSDEGPGVPADELDKLFKPFSRTRVTGSEGEQSTGLGLAIAKRIVEGHGGRIDVENPPGGGATFTMWLPAAPPGPRQPGARPPRP